MLDNRCSPLHNTAMQQGPYIFSVQEITRYLKAVLEHERTLQGVLVRGEISNCKYHTSGHLYFTLKDENSAMPCVMWRDRVRSQAFRCENGMRVVAEGSVTVYERGGYYQLSVYDLQADGIGSLYLAFEQLKRKLSAEGLFDEERKRPLPFMPRRIALISSPTGAVVHDFVTVSTRRWPGRNIVLIPTTVQGADAPASIVHSLELAQQTPDVDLIVVARGGGSFEDLACFNDERVARAIAEASVPVVSAIGHETDFTIADFVADLRAPTPSAAAELAVPDLQGISAVLTHMEQRLFDRMRQRLDREGRDLQRAFSHPAFRDPRTLLRNREQAVDLALERIVDRMRYRTQTAGARLKNLEDRIAALDPRGVLLRGYALVTREDGSLIASAEQAQQEQGMAVQFFDGTVRVARVGEDAQ